MTSSHEGSASARLPSALGVLVFLAFTQACANDTGNPKLPTGEGSMFGVAGFSGPVAPPVAGRVGAGGRPAGEDFPTGPPPPDAMSCRVITQDASLGLISDDCTACTCDTDPAATAACTSSCWRLLICVSEHCDPTDTNCVIATCADDVGGAANLAMAGALARATPFTQCASKCARPFEIDDAGPGGDL